MQVVTIRGATFSVDPSPYEQFWAKVVGGTWEAETFDIFDAHITPDTLMLDIGAWIGPTSLYAAHNAAQVVAFEPDPVAFERLSRNLELNRGADWAHRLKICQTAISANGEPFRLGSQRAGGDSRSSALFADRRTSWEVETTRLETVLKTHATPGQPIFLKIDIEGGEYDLVPHIAQLLAEPHVTAYISFHPKNLQKALGHRKRADYDWQTPYVDRHMASLAALPDKRTLRFTSPDLADKAAVEQALRSEHRFPLEVLIA
ncbi:FkbM family methyltransferase [uncultured Roseicyclus sp.]|jgi:FkbM family methyltransferase|uniref:FkbM family methyltransferase n=1 Tax=uncultured Roseicyclus sp. TaxID=543072 RepID=UPI002630DD59|nr:FkbM family methyltransferase [uncultured Roseicyclus sp.]